MTTQIPLLPPAPSRRAPSVFSERMDAFLAALEAVAPTLNIAFAEVAANAAGASGAASAAASSASGALTTKALIDTLHAQVVQYRDAAAASAVAAANAVNAPNYSGNSNTNVTIGSGLKVFQVETGKGWVPGMRLTAYHALGQEMSGVVVGYAGSALSIDVGRMRGTGAFDSWAIGPSALDLDQLSYADRDSLRTYANSSGIVLVDGLGLFVWQQGGTDPDDGETCFMGNGGTWELRLPDIDAALSQWLGELDDIDVRLDTAVLALTRRIAALEARPVPLRGSFVQSATSLAAQGAVPYDVAIAGAAVGDDVLCTPPGEPDTAGYIAVTAYVSAAGNVRVQLRNGGPSTATLNTGTWSVTVFRK